MGIAAEDLFLKIKQDQTLAVEVSRLRKLRELDIKAYKMLKTRLPYFVGASFREGVRHSDNFEKANYLTIDVDDYFGDNTQLPPLLLTHPSVLMAFVSPSGTGFKVIFGLNVPCADLIQYKEFYRNFSRVFAEQVHLAGSIDMKTCDATRACFLSFDENVYFNPNAELVEWQRFINQETVAVTLKDVNKTPSELDNAALGKVMDKISPNRPIKKVYQGYVPDELKNIEQDIAYLCTNNNLVLVAVLPISYGLKIQVKQGYRLAEINVFFGKKGYTVTRSPKTGTDANLSEVVFCLIHDMIFPPVKVVKVMGEELTQLLCVN